LVKRKVSIRTPTRKRMTTRNPGRENSNSADDRVQAKASPGHDNPRAGNVMSGETSHLTPEGMEAGRAQANAHKSVARPPAKPVVRVRGRALRVSDQEAVSSPDPGAAADAARSVDRIMLPETLPLPIIPDSQAGTRLPDRGDRQTSAHVRTIGLLKKQPRSRRATPGVNPVLPARMIVRVTIRMTVGTGM
jgi:hypothetical protein